MQKIIIIGENSYLASGLRESLEGKNVNVVSFSYDGWENHINQLQEADVIINFAIAPEFSTKLLTENEIIDVKLANAIKDSKCHLIFLSSRTVYGASVELEKYTESSPLLGQTFYAKNKIYTEDKLQEILDNKVSILRISNIIGDTKISLQHRTFMGWILSSMKNNGKLDVNISSKVVKDFITKNYLHKVFTYFLLSPQSGVFNVSSNIPIPTVEILKRHVGAENINYIDEVESEQFLLDNTKLYEATDLAITKEDIFAQADNNHKEILKLYS